MNAKIFLTITVHFFVLASFSQDAGVRTKHFNLDDGVAIHGFDPVAYFTHAKAIKGKKDIAAIHEGVTYRFATVEDKEAFTKNPVAYEPQYGGWCAYAMGNDGSKVNIDPETFKIINNKLYLFYNSFFNNTLKSWNKDEARLKQDADANWQNFLSKKVQ
jgi:YHS domain-containing protein